MNKFKEGTIFELDKGKDYMIVDSLNKGENEYLLSSPVFYEEEKAKTDFTKLILVRVNNKTDEMEVETNEKIIGEVVRNSLDKINA